MNEVKNTENLKQVVSICKKMLELADRGDKYRFDAGCGVVYGTLRDDAYKIMKLAEKELAKHLNMKSVN